jgi:DNA-binding NtrC family response regulator
MIDLAREHLRMRLGGPAADLPLAPPTSAPFGVIVGESQAMRQARAVLERAAATDFTVLIEGETGTGKERAAEFLHERGARRSGPFVVVDCGSIPSALLESELFGHERGSFTGAVSSHAGAFETAAGGTVFLDEICELSLELQPKLLRVLERREVKRVGNAGYRPVDVRLVAASSRNLLAEVNAQRFRRELYYRLAVVKVALPPLRRRLEDLPLLVEHILAAMGAAGRPEAAALRTAAFREQIARHAWPGNVRELRNFIERCLALGPVPVVDEEDVDDEISWGAPIKQARDEVLRRFERRYLVELLARHPDNLSAAARAAGVDRVTLYRMMVRSGLRSAAGARVDRDD